MAFKTPKRILLISTGHIGDAVIATSLLPVLKSAYPGVEIGFVIASWAQMVIDNHPDVAFTHIVDHKIMNRKLRGRAGKQRYARTRKLALQEIKELRYDVSLCLHPWRPDLLRLAWQANIPIRVAFSNSIVAPLATHLAEYPEFNPLIPHGQAQARLLEAIGITEEHLRRRKSSLPPSSDLGTLEVLSLLGSPSITDSDYCVIHMGSGVPAKELPNAFWREMAAYLSQRGKVIFTGSGPSESANIEEVTSGLNNCFNSANNFSWEGFVAAIRYAKVLYSIDTVAGHVAAALSTPCVAMFGGNNGVGRWRPEGENCIVWSNAMPCAPCRRMHGCSEMKCMQGFSPASILAIPTNLSASNNQKLAGKSVGLVEVEGTPR